LTQVANVIVLTGGTKRWQNSVIPANECIIWEVADGWLTEVTSMGLVNMGDPATLTDFIRYGHNNYPASKYGLILWDHGGGSIAGFGHDEMFNDSALTLDDMQKAFDEAGLGDNKLEFLGYDACLMATVEMAILAADYAHVLVASEDLEPGDGWDYVFLSALNMDPFMDGFTLGQHIVDTFIDFYGPNSDELLSLSVIDLSSVHHVMTAMGQLMAKASSSIAQESYFDTIASRRGVTKTFGDGSPRDNYSDMVDIGDMALQLSDLFPNEAAAVFDALDGCVTYNRHNSDIELFGLSTYYVYGGKSEAKSSLKVYTSLDMDDDYTQYLHNFYNGLVSRGKHGDDCTYITSELVLWQPIGGSRYRMAGLMQTQTHSPDLLWPNLFGQQVALYPIASSMRNRFYAIPAQVNGREGDIIVVFNSMHQTGHIKGVRYQEGYVIQKGHDPIEQGDKISIYALEWDFDKQQTEINWYKGDEFTVTSKLQLTWDEAPRAFKLGFRHTDICHDVVYTKPI